MIHTAVRITMPDGENISCGEMVTTPPDFRGIIKGAFRYSDTYLNHPGAFALDPNQLPLSTKEYQTTRPCGVHAVFEDALPDDWGRRLLIRKGNLKKGEQTISRMLQVLGAQGLGALSFFPADIQSEDKPYVDLTELNFLLDAAYQYDAGRAVEKEEMALLFRAASSPGGARPKALVMDENGGQWIAKFPSSKDRHDMVAMEEAALTLARSAGLDVPEFFVKKIGRRRVLFINRFDVTAKKGRHHMISGQTLLSAEGYYVLGYSDLFSAVRKVTHQPSSDLPALYRQMVFNAAIGNTDDHLKNFTMLHGGSGFFLSPAYDLVPDTGDRREHVLYFRLDHQPPNRDTLLRMADRWRIKKAPAIIDKVAGALSSWRSVFKKCLVPHTDIHCFTDDILSRLSRISH